MNLHRISNWGTYKFFYRSLILVFILSFSMSWEALSQTSKGNSPTLSTKGGIGIVSADSNFSLNFRFRIQSRFLMHTVDEEDFSPNSWEARVRRTRLSFTGHIYDPRLTYYLQLSFSRGDMDWSMVDTSKINTSVNVVRDAVFYFKPVKNLQLGFGQTKLPGNRQRVISSGSQQFYDRSNVNAMLTLDRDFGLFAQYAIHTGKVKTLLKGAVTSGEGRNSVISNSGLAYTGRVEVLPFGEFTDGGDYYEGDLAHEQKPKLSVAGGYHFNDLAMRTQGQLGRDMISPVSYYQWLFDALLKYKGWAASYEYITRESSMNPVTTASNGARRSILLGNGYNAQLSYCTKNMWEIAGRYAYVAPGTKVAADYRSNEQYGLGVTKYFIKHKVKAQFNVFHNLDRNTKTGKTVLENYFAVFQIELGI